MPALIKVFTKCKLVPGKEKEPWELLSWAELKIKVIRLVKQRLFSRLFRKECPGGIVKHHDTTLRDRTGRATKIPWEEITQGLGEHIKHREATGLQ